MSLKGYFCRSITKNCFISTNLNINSSKHFASLGIAVTINLALQFFFQWYIIISFGAGFESDVFFGAMAVPQFILLVLSSSITMVLIPILSRNTREAMANSAWNYFQMIGLVFGTIALVLGLTAGWWVHFILPGLAPQHPVFATDMVRIQLVAMFFSALLSVNWAVQSAQQQFFKIENTSIVANLISLVLLWIAVKYWGIYAAAWISVLRVLLQVIFLMPGLGKYQKANFSTPEFKEVWRKLKPLIAGNVYFKTDTVVDRNLTSMGASGELTLLNLAQQLYGMGNGILNKVFINTLIPQMAQKSFEKDQKGLEKIFWRRFVLLTIISIVFYLLLVFIGKPVLGYLFSFKSFTYAEVERLWWILILLAGIWFGGLLGTLTSSTFYAVGDTKTPTLLTAVIFTVYLPFKIICFKNYGIAGLAISISVYMLLTLLFQLYFLYRKNIIRYKS
ncbi:MAG: lipid II flippase MurJ [Ferruginibacter sp.]